MKRNSSWLILLLLSVIVASGSATFLIRDFNGEILNSIEPNLLKLIHQDLIKEERQSNATDLLTTYNITSGDLFDRLSSDFTSNKRHNRPVYTITIDTNIQDSGWSYNNQLGQVVGTEGRSLRMEAYRINSNPYTSEISYRSHVQNIGWQNYVQTNQISGTTGQSLRLEALQINIGSSIAGNIYYRCHLEGIGWVNWVGNNEVCGTTGQARRLEALVLTLLIF